MKLLTPFPFPFIGKLFFDHILEKHLKISDLWEGLVLFKAILTNAQTSRKQCIFYHYKHKYKKENQTNIGSKQYINFTLQLANLTLVLSSWFKSVNNKTRRENFEQLLFYFHWSFYSSYIKMTTVTFKGFREMLKYRDPWSKQYPKMQYCILECCLLRL